jgi:hypothetical protein
MDQKKMTRKKPERGEKKKKAAWPDLSLSCMALYFSCSWRCSSARLELSPPLDRSRLLLLLCRRSSPDLPILKKKLF